MKKKSGLKKLIAGLLVCLTLCGCKSYGALKPAKKADIKGTYELVTYKVYGDNGTDVNLISEYGVKAYLVIDTNGIGYYLYKDNHTSKTTKQVSLRYLIEDRTDSTSDNEKIEYIVYDSDSSNTDIYKDDEIGIHEMLGVHIGWSKTLKYSITEKKGMTVFGVHYEGQQKLSVKYKKINSKTDPNSISM